MLHGKDGDVYHDLISGDTFVMRKGAWVRKLRQECGRVHLGPVLVNERDRMRASCMACGKELTLPERAVIHRMWEMVNELKRMYCK